MQQEAHNTENHTRLWSNSNLRHKTVQFVSAGQLQRSEPDGSDGEEHDRTETRSDVDAPETKDSHEPAEDDYGAIFLDSARQDIETGLPDPIVRIDDTDLDESSEDEVVFTGRNPKPVVVETSKDELHAALSSMRVEKSQPSIIPDEQATRQNDQRESSPPSVASTTRHRHGPSHVDAVDTLADYIANIDQDYYEDPPTQSLADINDGMNVGQVPAQAEIAIEKHQVHAQGLPSGLPDSRTEDEDESQVQSSIDGKLARTVTAARGPNAKGTVLSRMYLDTEPEASPGSDDEHAELSTQESDVSSEDENELDDLDLLEELAVQYSTKGKKSSRSGQNLFPPASAFADALESDPYYGFDIMDFDRPSLQKKSKGKKPPALEDLMLSDSDLDFQIHEAWQNDRKKKKTKKKERDELRSQGLLGRSPGDADLKIKYAKGMNMEDLVTELRTFMLSPKDRSVPPNSSPPGISLTASSLSLPPMTKHRRIAIHELANKVGLKSQSRGNGPTRFPIVIKTARTAKYTRKTIPQFDHLISGRKLNRRLFQSWGSDASRPSKVKRGAAGAAVSYMDGDVVGASAPEIGTENRGRAMLEKMGWSSGTALGASDNKGILQPVVHVVKNSRAGLG